MLIFALLIAAASTHPTSANPLCEIVFFNRPSSSPYPVEDVEVEVDSTPTIVRARVIGVDSAKRKVFFQPLEYLRGGSVLADTLRIDGYVEDRDDFQTGPVPYRFVRRQGQRGSCYAMQYRMGAEYLLLLREGTPYWWGLGPSNEQVRGAADPWVNWVRARVRPREGNTRNIAGMYRVAVCKHAPCLVDDTTTSVVHGTIVLLDSSFDVMLLPDSARNWLFSYAGRNAPNGCRVLSRPRRDAQTYAGGVGSLAWTQSKDLVLHFGLWGSPDAGNYVDATWNDGRINGVGRSWGSGATEVHWPPDTIVAMRIGPGSLDYCIRSAIDYGVQVHEYFRTHNVDGSLKKKEPH